MKTIIKLTLAVWVSLNSNLLFSEPQFDKQSNQLKETLMHSCMLALSHGGVYSDQTDIVLSGRAIVGRGAGKSGFSEDIEVFTKKGVYLIKEAGGCEKMPQKEFDAKGDGRLPKGEPNNLEEAAIQKISAVLSNKNLNGFDQKAALEAFDTCSKVAGPLGEVAQREKQKLLNNYSSSPSEKTKERSRRGFNHEP